MLTSGFTGAPITKLLLFGLITSSILASVADIKHYFYIQVSVHLWKHRQLWRLLTWQLCYVNSTELLFAAMTLYHMRVIERLWGSRKYMSFLVSVFIPTTIITPVLVTILRSLTFNHLDFLPAGPTPLFFALLAQYHAAIPTIYKYRVVTATSSTRPGASDDVAGPVLSDKSMTYLVAGQLALSSLPGSAVAAAIGWSIGAAWRGEWGPGLWSRWRVPEWMVGDAKKGGRAGFEGLSRRMEGDIARGSGRENVEDAGQAIRRRN